MDDLILKMKECLHDTTLDPYSAKFMKSKLLERYGDTLIITELNGRPNVVTFRQNAESILFEFYKNPQKDNCDEDKLRIMETAAEILKSDIRAVELLCDTYPSRDQMESATDAIDFLPASLQTFIRRLFAGKQNDVKIASIGQSIMQATKPRVLLAPIQLGLGVQMHHHFASRFLTDSLHEHGFSCSYSEVQKYERSAAVNHGTYLPTRDHDQDLQFMADNVDHNIATINGTGTFHGMGMIATITPGKLRSKAIPRVVVSSEDIKDVGKINIRYFKSQPTSSNPLIYRELVDVGHIDRTTTLDVLWKTSLFLRSPILDVGEKALVIIYNGSKEDTLDNLRYKRLCEKVAKSSKYVKPQGLPPTSAAAQYHSLRVYYQIQVWKGCHGELDLVDFGWKICDGLLLPVLTDKEPAPNDLLEVVRCNCKSGCNTNKCTCRKHGLECSYSCGQCKGITCSNSPECDHNDDE